ncbi:sensor histidine kinase [Clostridium sp. Marseille-P2415]|uniref:sensor histidine kinase n=1 Tax=Clostridium sp. Marseille-P2415 TaxID=1805471 RepID=UPI001F363413|nr:HAMP domain-containing sensor histidine kinase [Clostridium sp. Marseille-P2415]
MRLEFKLAICTIISFLIASMVFLAVRKAGNIWIENSFRDFTFVEKQQNLELESLQEYISKNHVSALDYHQVSHWVKKRELTAISLYYGDRLIYDSTISYHAGNLSSGRLTSPLPWQKTYPLHFDDIEVTAVISTFSQHRFEDKLNMISLAAFFITFLLLMLFYVQKKVVYIHRLVQEIKNIENGNLNFPITMRGTDELAFLAQDVDKMRHSLLKQMIRFQKVRKDRDQFAVHMSHDLRTPITSLIGYLDFVNQKRCPTKEIQEQYLQKAEEKALQLRELSENMFKHFLTSVDESQSEDILCDTSVINQLIDDGLVLLESHLFQCTASKSEEDSLFFAIRKASLQRVFDNIFSNILKYADPTVPVVISGSRADGGMVISFHNQIRQQKTGTVSSAGIGLKSAEMIVQQNGGYLLVHKNEDSFECSLFIPEIT